MMHSQEAQELARHLLDYETATGYTSVSTKSAVIRVCEKLRLPLSAIIGAADYRSMLSRALVLAKLEAPSLNAVQVAADGSLQVLSEIGPDIDRKSSADGEVILLAQLLGLFLTFLGAALTLQLLEHVSPPFKATKEPGTSLPFTGILQEVIQLNNVSSRLESMADDHPLVEGALMTISGNIRNTATMLEVLAVIKGKSYEPQEDKLKTKPTIFLM